MVVEFIEGWNLHHILGEGTFGEVKLLVNKENGEACAMKEVDLSVHPDAEECVKKEICVHKLLKHRNVVGCYGSRCEGKRQFIFLEYLSGGELFDRITPDKGMEEWRAQRWFNQLIAGLEYLHKKGVSHRDIKPENLLLDGDDNLKISDFGMATVFRHKGKERHLERRCGTMPYIAPEILTRSQYNAEPADIWSCGVVLTAMLTGELPWDKPTSDEVPYNSWKDANYQRPPWSKVDNVPLSLLRKVLMPVPSKRYTLTQIKNHVWLKKKFKQGEENTLIKGNSTGQGPFKRLCSRLELRKERGEGDGEDLLNRDYCSQPLPPMRQDSAIEQQQEAEEVFNGFTQPANFDDMVVSSQGSAATQSSQTQLQRLVKRFTRFWVKTDKESTEEALLDCLELEGYDNTMVSPGTVTVTTTDRRGGSLVFKAILIVMDKKVLLEFRLSRGCGLEFKRIFSKIRERMEPLIVKGALTDWSLTNHVAVNAMPQAMPSGTFEPSESTRVRRSSGDELKLPLPVKKEFAEV